MAEAPNAQREGAAFKPGDLFQQRYRIVRALNAGSMGAVYEVVDERTNAPRALKVMHPSLLENADQRARFAQEARVTGAIDSEHIVRTLDAGVEGETPFLVMELLRGEDLGSIVARKRALPATEVLLYLMQVARALARTHAAGIVHRDLKPDNLFVAHRDDGSPCIKILDFGVAKLVTSAQAKKTRALGTPLFMAPEQARGEPTIGPRADLYALAHVAYGLLTGEPYWADEAAREPIVTLLRRILGGAQEPATARAKRRSDVVLPAAFDAWFARATAVDPAARFEAALSQIESLSAIFEERPSIGHATTVPAPEPAGAPARPSALPTVVPTGASATVSAAPIAGSTVVPSATAMMPASDPTRGRTAFMPQPPAAPPAPPAPPAPTAHASPIAPIAPPPARTQPRQGLHLS
ncbi:MAG: serine/threonine-protein kinase [Polyangiaceae bacterium]